MPVAVNLHEQQALRDDAAFAASGQARILDRVLEEEEDARARPRITFVDEHSAGAIAWLLFRSPFVVPEASRIRTFNRFRAARSTRGELARAMPQQAARSNIHSGIERRRCAPSPTQSTETPDRPLYIVLMDENPLPKPWMPRIKNFSFLGPVGVMLSSCIMTPERISRSTRTAHCLVACNFPPPVTLLPSPGSAVCIIAMSVEPHETGEAAGSSLSPPNCPEFIFEQGQG